jgi:hypothetical protein
MNPKGQPMVIRRLFAFAAFALFALATAPPAVAIPLPDVSTDFDQGAAIGVAAVVPERATFDGARMPVASGMNYFDQECAGFSSIDGSAPTFAPIDPGRDVFHNT